MTTYKIIRFNRDAQNQFIEGGLTLEEAQEWCNNPETEGDGWFDGYTRETEGDDER